MDTNSAPKSDEESGDEAAGISEILDSGLVPQAEPPIEQTEPEWEQAGPARSRKWIGLVPIAIFGLLMFLLGGVGGFVGRPYLLVPTPTLGASEQQQAKMQELLEMLVSKTRHFKGSANAPVTLLEFGDFQ